MTEKQTTEYVKQLEPVTQNLYKAAVDIFKESADTLTEDFQIASAIINIFEQRAARTES